MTKPSIFKYPLLGVFPLVAALALGGCRADVGNPGTSGSGGTGGGVGTGSGGAGAASPGGSGGLQGACMGATDPRLVVAEQRILRLTLTETVNTVRYLIDGTEATALMSSGIFNGGDIIEKDRLFPPLQESTIIGAQYQLLDNIAKHVSDYVLTNYAKLTMALAGCSDATDTCATNYLNKLAPRAYRRQLTAAEQTRVTGLYNTLRSQNVNGYLVTTTVQEATSYAVYGLLSSPQMLWRWEIGNPAMASTAPAGIPLTDAELATHMSFFLTDQPPDDMLLAAANGGTLRNNLASHVDRLLGTQAAKDWLRTIIETVYLINQLPNMMADPAKFPIYGAPLVADMQTEAHKFLDNVLWNGKLTDLFTSRTTFLNTGLAENIYKVTAPNGATGTNFVQTTLPSDQRAGILTNAAFITSRGRSDGKGLVIPRGRAVAASVLCMPPDPPPDSIMAAITAAKEGFDTQTAQEQVAYRKSVPLCNGCHGQFDAYGLVLDYYDNLGRYQTRDHLDKPIDGTTDLPATLGGGKVKDAVELAEKLAASPAFTNCIAKTMLQYAMVDYSGGATVQLPAGDSKPGCAAADVAQRYNGSSSKTFADLIRATTTTPAFALRRAAAQ